jgi:SpoVK/Ycf46/Vps4 family AAA+-type ATPase
MKSQATLMQVNPSDLFKMGHHNSIKPSPAAALEAIFQAAFEHRSSTQKPVIIFFDEVDFAGRKRTTTADLEVTTLTAELLLQTAEAAKRKGIYLMAATNYFDNLDEALKRDGRFGKHVCLKNPEIETIQALITNATSNTSSSDVVQRVAQKALGLSKAAIVESMQKAATGCLVTGLIKSDTESSIASSFLSKLSGLWKQQNQKDGGDDLIIKAVTQAPEAFWRYLIQSFEDKVSILKKV